MLVVFQRGRLPILTELVDSPIIEEFGNAVGNDSSKKNIKCSKGITLEPLYTLLYPRWSQGVVSQDGEMSPSS